MSQLVTVLEANWGPGWEKQFRRFSFTPMAAANFSMVASRWLSLFSI